jgi:uncharacterized membrane protein YuzA (DUF378 family)
MNRVNALDTISLILLIIGGLNWGSIGLTGVNFIDAIFGTGSGISSIIYILVGLAAIYAIYTTYKISGREAGTSR